VQVLLHPQQIDRLDTNQPLQFGYLGAELFEDLLIFMLVPFELLLPLPGPP